MNKNAINKTKMGRKTFTGKIPDNMGYPKGFAGHTVRRLTKAELAQQKRNLKTLNLAGL